jgi:hypothetical protein
MQSENKIKTSKTHFCRTNEANTLISDLILQKMVFLIINIHVLFTEIRNKPVEIISFPNKM